MLHRLRSSAAAVALTSGLVLIMSAVGAIPAAAAQGDIWTQQGGTAEETSGHSQEVHLSYGNVDIWGAELANTSGTWVLYQQPPPNPRGRETRVTTGTYSYSGDGSLVIATIPRSAFQNAPGHFRIELDNDNSKSRTFWIDCPLTQPSIKTTPKPRAATVGATLNDSAKLSGGNHPTGTIKFTLYEPSGAVAYTETVDVDGNATYSTATGHVAGIAGIWHWKAEYSGDANNKPVASKATQEPVIVCKEHQLPQPKINTAPNPTSASVGATLNDTATLSGGNEPTGTITFTLYDPGDVAAYTETVTVSGNGPYSTVHGFAATTAGTWHWSAAYSGDAKNKPAHSLKADEPVIVTEEHHPAQPTISTAPNPTSAIVGATLNDTATLSGGNEPTGTITFTLYDPNDASAYTESVNVDGNGQYSTATGHIADVVGTWHWSAAYSGDANNEAVHSLKADEPVVVNQAHPSISTAPDPTSAITGATLNDTATLSGGNEPTGTIIFTLYDPNDASAYTESVAVHGNGQYSTATGHVADIVGTWHWSAAYSGDANNEAVHSLKADEPVVVSAEHQRTQPSISTAPNPTTANSGVTLKDSATLSGGDNPTGTIKFTLYNPSNVAMYTESVEVDGNGKYSTAHGFQAGVAGTWHWTAEYSGDENNLPVASNAADEPVKVNASGEVLAATGSTPLAGALALVLLGFGGLAIMTAVALRRRPS